MSKLAVSYLRRSLLVQEQSIEGQRGTIEHFAKKHGYEIVKEFVDDGVSGTAKPKKRRYFLNMLEFVESSKRMIAALLVYDISRFGRTTPDEAAYYRHRLRLAGCNVIYVAENLPEGDSADLVRSVLQWHKREQVKQTARDALRTRISIAKRGYRTGGQPPFGYKLCYVSEDGSKRVRESGKKIYRQKKERVSLVPDSKERIAVVGRIFYLYVREGLGCTKIAERLNTEGAMYPSGDTTRKSRHWTYGGVRTILMNPVYVGVACFNRTSANNLYCIQKEQPKEVIGKKGRSSNPESEWIVVQNAHEAIVDREIFEKAQRIRERRASVLPPARRGGRNNRGKTGHSPVLLGLVYCGHCGYRMWHCSRRVRSKKKNYRYARYRCSGYRSAGKFICERYNIDSRKLEPMVVNLVRQYVLRCERQVEPSSEETELRCAMQSTNPGQAIGCQSQPSENETMSRLASSYRKLGDCRAVDAHYGSGNDPTFVTTQAPELRDTSGICEEYLSISLARQLVRSLVHRVVVWMKLLKRGPEKISYELTHGVLEINTSPPIRADNSKPQRVGRGVDSFTVIHFNRSDLEEVEAGSLRTHLLNFLVTCLSLSRTNFVSASLNMVRKDEE